jgi:hypothetical protein
MECNADLQLCSLLILVLSEGGIVLKFEAKLGRSFRTRREGLTNYHKLLVRIFKEREYPGDLDINERIILN